MEDPRKDSVITGALYERWMMRPMKHRRLFWSYVISLLINRRSWRG